jgi:hypothetical protein
LGFTAVVEEKKVAGSDQHDAGRQEKGEQRFLAGFHILTGPLGGHPERVSSMMVSIRFAGKIRVLFNRKDRVS